ncbi:molybdopterin molybdotransferase MoeA [Actinoplanes bogorensis]|uniref:Molybdopterin molybdenumtransferase n=1 Tax=Paractinoplanes bogorensis TaxID=1610840 RepID=A0ABS5YJ80_9ACTN|nr:molybdopterin molybdotransferase MoeA [Actinoplanes bogorensis]MBU2663538.1 molybdopterin molybdotransferase MoeA [Actinoplanes bogorensis]
MSDVSVDWEKARELAYTAGRAAAGRAEPVTLSEADGRTLAEPLRALTDLPAFPTSSIDGWAVRGAKPWRPVGRVLAGQIAPPLTEDGTCVEIATGAMVPAGAEALVRIEASTRDGDGRVLGEPRNGYVPEWRQPGEEAAKDEELLPAGTAVDPAVIGVAATCGYESLSVYPRPRAGLLVFGDELLTGGTPGAGRVRDSLGPQIPGWLRRLGATVEMVAGPVQDTLDAHVTAVRENLSIADVVCTTGGTMHGPVDHLHPALTELGAEYIVNTVAVRPGFPMLLARLPGNRFLAGLPGNPQSAVIALITLVAPLLAGLQGRPAPVLPAVELTGDVRGRGGDTHLALARLSHDGRTATPVGHVGSAMLRGLANAHGFAVVRPGSEAAAGDVVPFLPLPLLTGERP